VEKPNDEPKQIDESRVPTPRPRVDPADLEWIDERALEIMLERYPESKLPE
jgi:hypothetical protein